MSAKLLLSMLCACPSLLFAGQDANLAINSGVFTRASTVTATAGVIFSSDTFVGVDSSSLTAHTGELGATWVHHSSYTTTATAWVIKTNRASTSDALAGVVAYTSGVPPIADYDVEAGMFVVSANYNSVGSGIAARVAVSPVNSLIFFRYGTSGFQCFQTDTGTSLQIGVSSAPTLSVGVEYALKLSVVGDTVTGSVNGTTVCTGTTTVLSAGRMGLRGNTASLTTGPHISDIKGTSR